MAMEQTASRLEDGRAAFERGDFAEARRIYESLLEENPGCAEALDGLGETVWFLGDIDRGMELREQAYAELRRRGDVANAAYIALWLAIEQTSSYGNTAVADGWFRRAERLLEDEPLTHAHVELEIGHGRRAADPDEAERCYERAAEVARRLGDPEFEIRALSQIGVLHVSLGRVEEGMGLLDECMAAATGGELRNPWHIGGTCCMMLAACDQLSDLERATQWCAVVTEFIRRRNYTPLHGWCRSIYAGVLISTGAWEKAEAELNASLRAYGGPGRPMSVYPLARLAELRLRQGRLEEAAHLIAGHGEHARAVAVAIALMIERGDLALAEEQLERRLGKLARDHPSGAALLPLLATVRVRTGDLDGAREAVDRLMELARTLAREALVGTAELCAAQVSAASADGAAAAHLETALETFRRLGMPHEEGRARLALAGELAARGSPEPAVAEARAALQTFERLGALRDADEAAALLRSLGASGRSAPRGTGELTTREREVLDLLGEGLSNPEIGGRLFITPKTAEHHVSRILRKLGLRSRQEAAAHAVRQSREGPGGR